MQADCLESQMRIQLEIQEGIDLCLEQRDEELRQLRSQSQADGAQLAALSLQLQELISSVESRAEVVAKNLEEINGRFDCHRGEINCLKTREKDAKEETEQLKGFIVGAGHEARVFKNRLDQMEENVCRCGRTPSEVGEEFDSSEDGGRCQEIGLVALMFFFELLFSYVSLTISLYVSLTNLFSLILFFICQLPKTHKMKEKQDSILLVQEQSKNHFTT